MATPDADYDFQGQEDSRTHTYLDKAATGALGNNDRSGEIYHHHYCRQTPPGEIIGGGNDAKRRRVT